MIRKLIFVSVLFFSTVSIVLAMGPDELIRKTSEKLLEELWDDRECLEEAIVHPDSYSYRFQTYKEKYLDKLADLQRIWNELVILEKTKSR